MTTLYGNLGQDNKPHVLNYSHYESVIVYHNFPVQFSLVIATATNDIVPDVQPSLLYKTEVLSVQTYQK